MLDYRTTTFMTLYREMNYRKTAELLNMTQPGVTQHIHFLEKHYNVKLFHYNCKVLSRTPQAEALKQHIDSIQARERSLLQSFSRQDKVYLEVGATKTIGEFVLNDTLQQFLSNPSHSIRYVIDNTERLLEMLEDSQLDFAVIEGVFDKEKYGFHLMKAESFVGICSKNHPFAGKAIPLSRLLEETLVVREPGSGTRRLLEQAICDRGYQLNSFRRCISVSNFAVILDLVCNGAITFGYAPIAAQRKDLATFSVEHMQISGEFNFVYCDEESALEKIQLFCGQTIF